MPTLPGRLFYLKELAGAAGGGVPLIRMRKVEWKTPIYCIGSDYAGDGNLVAVYGKKPQLSGRLHGAAIQYLSYSYCGCAFPALWNRSFLMVVTNGLKALRARLRLEKLEDRCLLTGAITEFPILTASSGPFGIVTGPDGNLWFTEQTADKIARITTTGVITEFTVPTAASEPTGIVAGPDGNLWFTELMSGQDRPHHHQSGVITEFTVPTASSDPYGHHGGSGRRSLVHRTERRQDRPHHYQRDVHRVRRAHGRTASRPGS